MNTPPTSANLNHRLKIVLAEVRVAIKTPGDLPLTSNIVIVRRNGQFVLMIDTLPRELNPEHNPDRYAELINELLPRLKRENITLDSENPADDLWDNGDDGVPITAGPIRPQWVSPLPHYTGVRVNATGAAGHVASNYLDRQGRIAVDTSTEQDMCRPVEFHHPSELTVTNPMPQED